MNRIVPALLVAGLAATWIGCPAEPEPDVSGPPADASPSATSDYTLVTLKVPNMV